MVLPALHAKRTKRGFDMKTSLRYLVTLFAVTLMLQGANNVKGEELLRYSCSAQVFQAVENDRLPAFTKKTGITVQVISDTSSVALIRLRNGLSDLASTAERLSRLHKEIGFVETPFCKDPLAVVVNGQCAIENLTDKQLREIFNGSVKNWKELGGSDKEIVCIVPSTKTAALRNFSQQVMLGLEINYDIMTSQSTTAIEVTRRVPWSISFIARGAATWRPEGIRIIKVNGLSPEEDSYPYYQVFSFVTAGIPAGAAMTFIDFALSDEGKKIIIERGMVPLP
jgi:phosphate transport system substrate-binding protein